MSGDLDPLAFLADMFPERDLAELEQFLSELTLDEAVAYFSSCSTRPSSKRKRARGARSKAVKLQEFHRTTGPVSVLPSGTSSRPSFRDIMTEVVYKFS
jgi:hypothetical protein